VASIRLKMIREGMEDYEYLKLVSDLGDPAFAAAEAARLFPHPYSTGDVSAASLLAARERLARRILEARARSGALSPTSSLLALGGSTLT
jgi:hypothetical protein